MCDQAQTAMGGHDKGGQVANESWRGGMRAGGGEQEPRVSAPLVFPTSPVLSHHLTKNTAHITFARLQEYEPAGTSSAACFV